MFGEIPILGYKEVSVDEKGRIFLPKFTCAEKGDQVSVLENGANSFKLYNLTYLQNIINELNKSCDSSEKRKIQELSDRLQLLYYSYLATGRVDSQRRLNIPDQILREYGFKDTAIMQGCGTNLTIFNSRESYNEYVKTLRAK